MMALMRYRPAWDLLEQFGLRGNAIVAAVKELRPQ